MALRCCALRCNYQRGGWVAGSKHQKHMTLNPTVYLYRFPGCRGPGPYTMKYWWTLGCFPTGLTVPFRLGEFLSLYQQQHVPLEVEEWLLCFVKQPYDELVSAVTQLQSCLDALPTTEQSRGYTSVEPSVVSLLPALKSLHEQLGVPVPAFGVRCAAGDATMRARMCDALYDYSCALRAHGSTPHRRLACVDAAQAQPLSASSRAVATFADRHRTSAGDVPSAELADEHRDSGTATTDETALSLQPPQHDAMSTSTSTLQRCARLVDAALRPPAHTAADECALIRWCTVVAEACAARKHDKDAYTLLASLLYFAHDDAVRVLVHSNAAAAALRCGDSGNAEFHAREAVLLLPALQGDGDTSGHDDNNDNVDDDTGAAGCDVRNSSRSSRDDGGDGYIADRATHAPARQRAGVRAYTLWATAVAEKDDDYAAAMRIADDALALWPSDDTLQTLRGRMSALHADAASRRARVGRAALPHTPKRRTRAQQQLDGLLHGSGTTFDNEFDWAVFRNRLYPSKMHPRNNELGSVFRRVGHVGGFVSTSYAAETV